MEMFQVPKPTVTFEFGTTQFGPYQVTREQFPELPPGAAPHAVYQLQPVEIGGAQVLAIKLQTAPTPGAAPALPVRLHNFGPTEAFFVAFHVAFYAAMIISAPFWMYFMGSFIFPALNMRERRSLVPWLCWSLLLFVAGVLATYFMLLPVSLRASVAYSDMLGFQGFDWRADDYIGFVTRFVLGMGLGFQFPVIVLLLVKIGMLTHTQLAKYRRHVIVVSFILGAVLTTPEVVTQVAMAIPLILLYEICIWVAWYWDRKKRRAIAVT
jgi:sec-independent protein translocase protein TatC